MLVPFMHSVCLLGCTVVGQYVHTGVLQTECRSCACKRSTMGLRSAGQSQVLPAHQLVPPQQATDAVESIELTKLFGQLIIRLDTAESTT